MKVDQFDRLSDFFNSWLNKPTYKEHWWKIQWCTEFRRQPLSCLQPSGPNQTETNILTVLINVMEERIGLKH
jgi:hypothetical protein